MNINTNILFAIVITTLFISTISLRNKFGLEEERDVIRHCLKKTIFSRNEDVWLIQNEAVSNYNIVNQNQAIVLFNIRNFPHKVVGNAYPIIVTFDVNNFQKILDNFIKGFKILAIIQDEQIETLFKMAERNQIYDLTVAVLHKNRLDFYTWFYFAPDNFCGKYLNITLIDRCNETSLEPTNLFPVKFTSKPTNCVLNVGWWTAKPFVIDPFVENGPGIFVSIFRDVSWASGMVLKYEEKDPKAEWEFHNEGYYNHISKRLEDREIDVLLGQIYLNYSNVVYGPAFFSDTFVHVVRIPKKTKKYQQLNKVFALSTFLFVLLTYFIEVCFLVLLYKVTGRKSIDYSEILIKVISMALNLSAHGRIASISYFRIIFLFLAFYALILDTIFIGKLSSIFRLPIYEISINDVLAMYLNNFTFYVSMYVERQLMYTYSTFDNPKVEGMLKFSNHSAYDLFHDLAVTQENGTTVFFSLYYMYESERLCVNVMTVEFEYPSTLFNSYALQKNSFKNEVVNYWAREVLEKGFFEKHRKDIAIYYRNISLLKNDPRNLVGAPEILTIAHYEQLFLIAAYGYLLGLIIFILEWLRKLLMQIVNRTKTVAPF